YGLEGKTLRDVSGESSPTNSATESNEPASSDADDDSDARAPPVIQSVATTNDIHSSSSTLEQGSLAGSIEAENNYFTLSNDALPVHEALDDSMPRGPPASGDIDYLDSTGTPGTAVTNSLLSVPIANVTAIYQEAIARWVASGLIPAAAPDLALLDSTLTIADLGGDALASIAGTTITVDINADEFGWYVDLDPATDTDADTTFTGVDLLTVVLHEIGHYLGYAHGAAGLTALMAPTLAAGERLLPQIEDGTNLNDVIDLILATFDTSSPPVDPIVLTSADARVPTIATVGETLGGGVDLELQNISLTFSGLSYDSTASDPPGPHWVGQVGVEAESAVLFAGLLNIEVTDESADGLEVAGVINLGPGIASSLSLDSIDVEELGWPGFLEVEVTELRLNFEDFHKDDKQNSIEFELALVGLDTGIEVINDQINDGDNPLFGFSIEGFVAAELDITGIEASINAATELDIPGALRLALDAALASSIDGVAGKITGKLFKIFDIEAGFIINTVEFDPDGDGPIEARSTTYLAIQGSATFGELSGLSNTKDKGGKAKSLTVAFAISEQGPLQFFIAGGGLKRFEFNSGLTLEEVRLGVRFFTNIEGLQTETDFTAKAQVGVYDTATRQITLTIPGHDLEIDDEFRIRKAAEENFNGDFTVVNVNGDDVTYISTFDPGLFSGEAEVIRLTIKDPLDLNDNGLESGIAPPDSILVWKEQLDNAVIDQLQANFDVDPLLPPVVAGWEIIQGVLDDTIDVVIGGGATISIDPIDDTVLLFDVDFALDTDGNILLQGDMQLFDGAVSTPTTLFAGLGELASGAGRFLFLQEMPKVEGFDPLLTFRGEISFETFGDYNVSDATVNAASSGADIWTIDLQLALDNPSEQFAADGTAVIFAAADGIDNGSYQVIGVNDDTNTITLTTLDFNVTDATIMENAADGTWTIELEVSGGGLAGEFIVGEDAVIYAATGGLQNGTYEIINVDEATDTITLESLTDPGTWLTGVSSAHIGRADPGAWVPGTSAARVANSNTLNGGFQIVMAGAIDLSVPGIDSSGSPITITKLTLEGTATTTFRIPSDPNIDVILGLTFNATLSETNLGVISQASGDFTVTIDADGGPEVLGFPTPKVEAWGAALLTSELTFLEKYGLFAEVSGALIFNTTDQDQGPIQLETTGGTVDVTPTAETFALRVDGTLGLRVDFNDDKVFDRNTEQLFLLDGSFVLSFVGGEGLDVLVFSEPSDPAAPLGPATLEIGPTTTDPTTGERSDPFLKFNVFGFLAIRSNGVAANMVLSLDASAPGVFASVFNIDAQFVLMLNTTGDDISFEIPAGADNPGASSGRTVNLPRAPPDSIVNANLNITDLIAGNAWTAPSIGAPYILIHAGGTGGNPNASLTVGPFNLEGQFSFLMGAQVDPTTLAVTPLLEIFGSYALDVTIGSVTFLELSGKGLLRYDSSGLVAALSLTRTAGDSTSLGFELSTSYLLELNTTGSPYDPDGSAGPLESIEDGLRLHMDGTLDIAGLFVLDGTFDLSFESSGAELYIDAGFDLLGVKANITAMASLSDQGFTLEADLTLATGGGLAVVPGLFNIEGTFRLTLNTITGSASISIADANVNILGLVLSGSIIIGVDGDQFYINVPHTDPLRLDFFGVADLEVSGSFNYDDVNGGASGDNAFNFTATAGLNIGVEGVLGVKGDITVSFDSSGTFTGTVSGTAWILGISFDAAATLSISGSSISLKLKVSVTITPAFTIWNPFGSNIRVPALVATYRHTFNIGTLTPPGTFAVPDPDPLVLGRVDNGTLYLHIGADAGLRDPNNDWDDTEVDDFGQPNGDESFRVTHLVGGATGPETVRVDAFGQQQDFSGVERIVVTDAGNGTDVIDIGAGVLADATINGGDGADQISYLGGGRAILNGGEGNDQLVGGSGGTLALPDMLDGGNGDDRLIGGAGVSEVSGGGGNDTIVWNELSGAVLSSIDGGADTGGDFRDTLQVFANGASESATVSAATGGGFDVSIGAAVASASNVEGLILEMMGGGDTVTINDVTASTLERVIVRLGDGDGQQDHVIINGSVASETFKLESADFDSNGVDETVGINVADQAFIAIAQGSATGGFASGDRLTINGNGGNDTIDASFVDTSLLNMDFIFGNDGGSIEGSQLADQINVTVTGDTTGVLNLDGNGGGDAYTINLLGGNTNTEITIADTGGAGTDTVVVNGTAGAEQITLTSNVFQQGSNTETLNYSGLETFTINTVGDADQVTIVSTHAGTTTVNTGDGADVVAIQSVAGTTTITTGAAIDRVNVGSAATTTTNTLGTLNLINALLTINTGTDTDVLDLDDSGDGIANTDGQLTGVDLNGLGTSNGIDYSNVDDLRVHLGSAGDEFLIVSTHAGLTTVNGNGGADIISVRTISGATTINTGAATDRIRVGSNASATGNTGGTVNGISSQLTVDGGSTGTDVLDVDDRGDALPNTDGQLTSTYLTGIGMSDGINYSAIEDLQVHLGSAGDEFLIVSTHAGLTTVNGNGGADIVSVRTISGATTINTGAATDQIRIGSNASATGNTGGTVNGISAQLTVDGGSTGTDVLDVDDRGDSLANTDGELTNTDLTGLGMSDGINYSAIESLQIHLGTGSDAFMVHGTHDQITTIDGNIGDDIFNVRAAEGTVNINGDADNDIVNVSSDSPTLPSSDDDATDVVGTVDEINGLLVVSGGTGTDDVLNVDNSDPAIIGQDGTLTGSTLRGLSMPSGVNYSNLETLNIWLDSGVNRFDIDGTHSGATNVYARNGADEINVRATALGSTTSIFGQGGSDSVNISDDSPSLPADYPATLPPPAAEPVGNIDNVNGLVLIDGGLDDDTINIDDSRNGADKVATLTDSTLRGLALEGGVNYEDAEDFNIWLGTGTDTFYIASTHAGTTQLYAGDGNTATGQRDDTIAINTSSGVATIHGQGGNDGILVNVELDGGGDLPTLVGTNAANDAQFVRTDANGLDTNGLETAGTGGVVLNLHGEGGSDDYTVNLSGTGDALINVLDNGAAADGDDTLTINGADGTATENDTFLLRKDFVALLNDTDSAAEGFEQLERVNYDSNINKQLIVNGLGGEDSFAADDNSSLTTVDGGADNDSFQIGQIFDTLRTVDAANITDAADEFDTTRVIIGIIRDGLGNVVFDPSVNELTDAKIAEIEGLIGADGALPGIAYVSDGVSYETTVIGGDGDDDFSVYQNKAKLILEGDDGNDDFIVRAFVLLPESGTPVEAQAETEVMGGADDDNIQYAINAPVSVDGGSGFDTVVVLGTPFPDAFVVNETGIFGAGLSVRFENVESAELDALEGNDTIYVLATNENLVTRIIAGQGSDTVNVMGDVVENIVSSDAGDISPRDQDLGQIQGPLIVFGGVLEGADRTLARAIVLPGETIGDLFQENNSDQTGDIDRLDVFHTDSEIDSIGAGLLLARDNPFDSDDGDALSWTGLIGFGMNSLGDTLRINEGTELDPQFVDYDRGITFTGFEIFEVLLGQGNETLAVSSTPNEAITLIHGGGGDDTITISDRREGALVVYGDTSQDRARYDNADPDTTVASEHGTAFTNDGDDTIDASEMAEQSDRFVGVVIYGGFGDDVIDGSDDDDHIAGGTGGDTIRANAGNDHVYGDSHFNVDALLFAMDLAGP
ncbi:MAG: hypothetical protein OEM99_09825, partial [Gammaproteobacteria bacterium]|nr:hypothetical protein [Gammaproteobacteria bacterium]